MYKSIKIEGFRQFDNFEINDLGAVNIFLGPNNTGKSSILEAFYTHACGLNFNNFNKKIICGRRFNPPNSPIDVGNRIRSLFYSTETKPYKFVISITRDEIDQYKDECEPIHECIFEPSSVMSSVFDPRSEGYFDASFLENYKETADTLLGSFKITLQAENVDNITVLSSIINRIDYKFPNFSINNKYFSMSNKPLNSYSYPAVFHNILDHRYEDKDLVIFSHLKRYDIFKDFIEEIKEAFPIIKDIDYIPYFEGAKAPLLITIDNDKKLPLYAFGDGLRRWYHILGNMIIFQNAIHCIEEIDSTFHPESQDKLAPLLLRYSKKYNNQIMLTSHSLEFADAFLSSLYKDKNNELIKEGEDPVRIFTLAKDKNDKLEVWKRTGKEAFELRSKYKMELR